MKAYLSYSLLDREEYVISLLSSKLKQRGFTLVTGRNFKASGVDFTTNQLISTSQLFIGIVSVKGSQWKRVLNEWNAATQNKIPNVLLIEEGVHIEQGFNGSHVLFNRNNPQKAIDEINKKIMRPDTIESDEFGWVVGGIALIALIALLSGKK